MRTPREVLGLDGPGATWARALLNWASWKLVLLGAGFIAAHFAAGTPTEVWLGGALLGSGVICWCATVVVSARAARRFRRKTSRRRDQI